MSTRLIRRCMLFALAALLLAPTGSFADDDGDRDRGSSRGRGQGRGQGVGARDNRPSENRHGRSDRDGPATANFDSRQNVPQLQPRFDDDDHLGRTVVCHTTESNSNPVIVLVLPKPAANAHRRHGDILLDDDVDLDGDLGQRCREQLGLPLVPGQLPGQPLLGQCPGQGAFVPTPSAIASPSGSVVLSWQADPFVVSYRIYQAAEPGGTLLLVQVVPSGGTSATVLGLIPGQPYSFQVRSVLANGMEQIVVASAQGGSATLASANLCVNVEAATATTATLSWRPVRGADSYVVLQSPDGGQPFVPAAVSSFSSDEVTVLGLAPGRTYFFQVLALDAAGRQIAPSNIVAATTPVA